MRGSQIYSIHKVKQQGKAPPKPPTNLGFSAYFSVCFGDGRCARSYIAKGVTWPKAKSPDFLSLPLRSLTLSSVINSAFPLSVLV